MNPSDLQKQFGLLRAQGRRHRDAAADLGLSEGAVMAAHVGATAHALSARVLDGRWIELLQALEGCGPLLALTRNESTVHEKAGVYRKISSNGNVGLALGDAIDLRMFFDQWHAGFAIEEAAANGLRESALSLQFYDAAGQAVHKIFAREDTDRAAFRQVIDRFGDHPIPRFEALPPWPAPEPDASIDADGLAEAWSRMEDTHEFFPMLRAFKVERQQALRLTEGRFCARVAADALERLLQEAAMDGTPIMVFVGNKGCIQIHTGPVHRVEPMEIRGQRWLNVLDAGFNLHLRQDLLDQAWVVEKPTRDGVVTSVEAFDRQGELMAMFFGARKPGAPELEAWRALVARLPRLPQPSPVA